jgi:cytochrome c peroxidase
MMRAGGAAALSLFLAACRVDGSAPTPPATADAGPVLYPGGAYGTSVGATLADAQWEGVSSQGAVGLVSLGTSRARALDSAGGAAPLLVVRIGAAWCGTCQWHAAHGGELASAVDGSRVRFLDVLLSGRDNAPATLPDAVAWQKVQGAPTDVAIDPAGTTLPLLPAPTRLPYVLVVDARTMTLEAALSMPTEDALEQAVRAAAAALDGTPAPAAPAPTLVDGRFTRDEWDMVQAMVLTFPPPPDPTNAFADSIPASALGGLLFVDSVLSPGNLVSCSSCHEAARDFTDGSPTPPEGVGRLTRNAPSLTFVAYQRSQFWDGRADSLWAQALAPIESANEFGSSRLFVAHAVFTAYKPQYEATFGPMPPLGDTTRFPPAGKPGDPAWETMAAADQDAVTRVFVNVGKSLAAFERQLRGAGAQLDQYASGASAALTDAQKDGLLAFFESGCAQCHWGPRMTDDAFHDLRFPSGVANAGDVGRQGGIPQLLASEFASSSRWSDAFISRAEPTPGAWTLGAFKTPELRNVALTAPYGHGGNYVQLPQLVELIRTGGMPPDSPLADGVTEPWLVPFDAANDATIAAFLGALDEHVSH